MLLQKNESKKIMFFSVFSYFSTDFVVIIDI